MNSRSVNLENSSFPIPLALVCNLFNSTNDSSTLETIKPFQIIQWNSDIFVGKTQCCNLSKNPKLFIEFLFSENANFSWVRDMANALINVEELNVITVDWGELVGGLYKTAVSNIHVAGKKSY